MLFDVQTDGRPLTGFCDVAAIRAGAARVKIELKQDDTYITEWVDACNNVLLREISGRPARRDVARPFVYIIDDDMREWDREQDAHHAMYRREYDTTYTTQPFRRYFDSLRQGTEDLRMNSVRLMKDHNIQIARHGEWTSGEDGQLDIKEERGGALDEFLDEFKPQETTPERSDKQN